MADKNTARFSFVGRFKAFVPGKKSPYQRFLIEVEPTQAPDKSLPTAKTIIYQIKLPKALRKTLNPTLQPQDTVSVVGELSYKRNGQPKWKATALSKLTSFQRESQRESQNEPLKSEPLKGVSKLSKPVRILVCQKSSCRKRGSLSVIEAIEQELAQAHDAQKVVVRPTGCLGGCKSGPNAVTVPGKKQRQVKHAHLTPKKGRSLIKNLLLAASPVS